MKKLIAALLIAGTSMTAMADPRWGGHHGGYGGGHHGGYGGGYGYDSPRVYHQNNNYYRGSNAIDLLGPMVIGGIVGWSINEASRQPQIYQQQPTVIYQQPQTVYQNCTAWIETIDQYGIRTKTRTCY